MHHMARRTNDDVCTNEVARNDVGVTFEETSRVCRTRHRWLSPTRLGIESLSLPMSITAE